MSLKIENLNVSISDNHILKNIDLDIEEGEFVSILGVSGCGKTTLLKSIAGLIPIDSGMIFLDGEDISKKVPEKRGTVIVFQDLRLFPHMTVEKNIAFAMELKGVSKEAQRKRIANLLAAVQLPGFEKRHIKEMSGGQCQRVALARALAAEPKILLLDEPFSGLDESLREEMGQLVKELQERLNLTIIMVTHDKQEAMKYSQRIAVIDHGEILQYDSPEELFFNPCSRMVAEYMGQVNYIRATVSAGMLSCPVGEYRVNLDDGSYDVLVRPFSFGLTKGAGDFNVQSIYFRGDFTELIVSSEEISLRMQLSFEQSEQQKLSAGDRVELELDMNKVLIFSANEDDYEKSNS